MISKTLLVVLVIVLLVVTGISFWNNLTQQEIQVIKISGKESGNLQLNIMKSSSDKDAANLRLVVLKK